MSIEFIIFTLDESKGMIEYDKEAERITIKFDKQLEVSCR